VHNQGLDVVPAVFDVPLKENNDIFIRCVLLDEEEKPEDIETEFVPQGLINIYMDKLSSMNTGVDSIQKKDPVTYEVKEKYIKYLKSQGPRRLRDIVSILMHVPNSEVIALGDGVGIVQMACRLLGKTCVSYDNSPVAISLSQEFGNVVLKHDANDFDTINKKHFQVSDPPLLFISHVMDFAPNLVIDALRLNERIPILVFEKDPFFGFSKLGRFSYYGWCFYKNFDWIGGFLHLSGAQRIKQDYPHTFTKILRTKAVWLYHKRSLWVLWLASMHGISLRVKITYLSPLLAKELCAFYKHELVTAHQRVLIFGPLKDEIPKGEKVIDLMTGERHWKIGVSSRKFFLPRNPCAYAEGGMTNFSYALPGVKYYFNKNIVTQGLHVYRGVNFSCIIFPKGNFKIYDSVYGLLRLRVQ